MLSTGKDIHKNKRLKSVANESFMNKIVFDQLLLSTRVTVRTPFTFFSFFISSVK